MSSRTAGLGAIKQEPHLEQFERLPIDLVLRERCTPLLAESLRGQPLRNVSHTPRPDILAAHRQREWGSRTPPARSPDAGESARQAPPTDADLRGGARSSGDLERWLRAERGWRERWSEEASGRCEPRGE